MDFVVENVVFEQQFVVLLLDVVHLRGVEEEGEEQVNDRGQDEADQDFSQDTVETDTKRDRDHLVGEGLRVEFISFFFHYGSLTSDRIFVKKLFYPYKIQQN